MNEQTQQPKVSVILPCLNTASYIRECIESALNQTLREIEIICVDAGSTDGTWEILQEYARQDSRVKLLQSEYKSYGYQMNLGARCACGEYIAILESDDLIKRDMYEKLYMLAVCHRLDFVKSDYEIFVGEAGCRSYTYMNSCRKRNQYGKVIDPGKKIDIFNARMNTWTGLYNRQFLVQNNIWHNETSGASYQDNGFWLQTFFHAKRIMFVNKAFYQLRRDNPNSSVHSKEKVFCIFEEYDFVEKILRADPQKTRRFISIFQKEKFDNFQFHYSRVDDRFKLDFLRRMSEEFRQARSADELDERLFLGNGYQTLCTIMDEPEQFYIQSVQRPAIQSDSEKIAYLETQVAAYQQEIDALKQSVSYRIGRAITFIPRKLRGGIRCYQEHGMGYTLGRIRVKIRRLFLGRE